MKKPIVIIGIGELGAEFARGFLRSGYPVYPVTRQTNINELSQQLPDPELVLIAVQEQALEPVLKTIPPGWQDKLALIQNELLPRHWQQFKLPQPTVAVVWFEKKPDMVLTNILYTPVYGPKANVIIEALTQLGIPSKQLNNEDELLYELVRKALYILTVNICGLVENCTVGELWEKHRNLALSVMHECIQILSWLCNKKLNEQQLIDGVVEGIKDCPHRKCLGRRAKSRLERALQYAQEAGINTPKLLEIQQHSA
jgi:ketopantoate reductase